MLADEYREGFLGPLTRGGSPVHLHIYMPRRQGLRARRRGGRQVVQPVESKVWHIASHVEDVRPRELKKRAEKMMEHRGG